MVTRSSNLDFSIEFTHTFKEGEQERVPVRHFVKEVQDWDDNLHSYTIVRENINLELSFNSKLENARCAMDGFDILNDEKLKFDEKNFPYISPGSLTLYKHKAVTEYYPYIPGIYCLTVTIQEEKFFSFIKVISSRLTDDQLQSMRIEVENQLKGLALDVVRKQSVFQGLEELNLDMSLFQQFKTLDHYFGDISTIIADLTKRVRSSLKKEYILQPVEKPSHVDPVSIHYRLKHPESTNYLKTRKNIVDYDLPENRLLKQIINKWISVLVDFIQQIDYNLEKFNGDNEIFSSYTSKGRRKDLLIELDSFRTRATQMKAALNQLRISPWYQEVSDRAALVVTNKMFIDIRYNKIYKIHQHLSFEEVDLSLHPGWSFHWKRTDQLYEIWSFFKVLNIFKAYHFTFGNVPKWLLNGSEEGLKDLMVIPTIPKGASFELQKGDLKLRIVYDREIPKEPSQTDHKQNPIYTTGENNTPDIRIDVYIREIFIGSIIMDSKYRKKHVLMDSKYQLTSYADHVRSPYIYNKKRWERIRPVHRVLVLYPDKWGKTEVEYLDDKSISLVPLTPETDFKEIGKMIQGLVDELVLDAEDAGVILLEE
ncbi:DUF2357 domain-containing protein [Bacillus sp. KH172YL63]|uniref:DUF2357 domain-containing protein n=1 Tax=Bacillus sp. KH172YL63 TaxID=2709784 RepID=UPI0013E47FE0|nr:DUF2357 domain-containing protein [Bacillus sp. KH172YL63]BCB02144.1 hypothetical protein KH172YL63_02770 [Bacillus sp. KH172YL63]